MGAIFSHVKDKEGYSMFMEQYWLEVVLVLLILHAVPVSRVILGRKAKVKRFGLYIVLVLTYVALVCLVTIFPWVGMVLKGVIVSLLIPAPPGGI